MTDIRNIAHLVSDIKADLSAATGARPTEQADIPQWRQVADKGIEGRKAKRLEFDQQFKAATGKASPAIDANRVAAQLGLNVSGETSRTSAAPATPAMQRTAERQR